MEKEKSDSRPPLFCKLNVFKIVILLLKGVILKCEIYLSALLGAVCVSVMFIEGLVIAGTQINLQHFSNQCGVSLMQASGSLLFLAFGAGVGAVMSSLLLDTVDLQIVMLLCSSLLAVIMGFICSITSLEWLFLAFAFAGIISSIHQSAVYMMLRETFQQSSGPWLQATNFSFQLGFVCFPLLNLVARVEMAYYIVFGIIVVNIVFASGVKVLSSDKIEKDVQENSQGKPAVCIVFADILVALGGFFFISILAETMTFLEPFIADSPFRDQINPIALIYWCQLVVLASQLLFVKLQQSASRQQIVTLLIGCITGAIGSCFLPLLNRQSVSMMWISVIGLGFFWGPLFGLLTDLWVKCTEEATLYGAALLTCAVNCLPNLYTIAMYIVWVKLDNPGALFWGNIFAFVLSLLIVVMLAVTPEPMRDSLGEEKKSLIASKKDKKIAEFSNKNVVNRLSAALSAWA